MIFIDSSAWIALLNRRDQYHSDAAATFNDLVHQDARFLTTDYVIDETATRLRSIANHSIAIMFLDQINDAKETGILTVAVIDSELFLEAERLFRQYKTATLSFTDCTSFAVCQKHKVSKAFAFDRHFNLLGIILVGE